MAWTGPTNLLQQKSAFPAAAFLPVTVDDDDPRIAPGVHGVVRYDYDKPAPIREDSYFEWRSDVDWSREQMTRGPFYSEDNAGTGYDHPPVSRRKRAMRLGEARKQWNVSLGILIVAVVAAIYISK